MDFRFYIILGIIYLAYSIYNRAKANQQKKAGQNPSSTNTTSTPSSQEGGLFEQLRRMAEEAARKQQEAASTPTVQYEEQEYPDEWVTTETGTRVRDLEGRSLERKNLREEYLSTREEKSLESSALDEYRQQKERGSSQEEKLMRQYELAQSSGRPLDHSTHPHPRSKGSTKRIESRKKKTHPLKKELFNTQSIQHAFILKEVLERPKHD